MRGGNLCTLSSAMRRIKCTNFTIFHLVSYIPIVHMKEKSAVNLHQNEK